MNHPELDLEGRRSDRNAIRIPAGLYLVPVSIALFFLLIGAGITAVDWFTASDAVAQHSAARSR